MPVAFVGGEADDVAGADLLDRRPLALTQPRPQVTINVWPSGCVCQLVRAAGSKVTCAPATCDGGSAANNGSMRTVPVNQSAGPSVEGCVPLRVICITVPPGVTGDERLGAAKVHALDTRAALA
ncbi:hypothetical protein [Sphingomonas citricola]|uniref:hypothetical protein n=1 Tax=Sphingomonas citricola TaxID=2862498 RepID=UPI0027E59737|nr:hypothetical protein [Sphingomonas citricola]